MKKLDFTTSLVVLAAVVVGYLICLALPIVQAERPDATTVDRLLVTDYIEFSNGARIYVCGDMKLCFDGSVQLIDTQFLTADYLDVANTINCATLYSSSHLPKMNNTFNLGGSSYKWANVYCTTLHAESADGKLVVNLNADQLDGSSAEDFVLKSEFQQWFKQCPRAEPLPLER